MDQDFSGRKWRPSEYHRFVQVQPEALENNCRRRGPTEKKGVVALRQQVCSALRGGLGCRQDREGCCEYSGICGVEILAYLHSKGRRREVKNSLTVFRAGSKEAGLKVVGITCQRGKSWGS